MSKQIAKDSSVVHIKIIYIFVYKIYKKKREKEMRLFRLWGLKLSIILLKWNQCLCLFWVKECGGKFNNTHYEDACDSAHSGVLLYYLINSGIR